MVILFSEILGRADFGVSGDLRFGRSEVCFLGHALKTEISQDFIDFEIDVHETVGSAMPVLLRYRFWDKCFDLLTFHDCCLVHSRSEGTWFQARGVESKAFSQLCTLCCGLVWVRMC